MHVRVSQLCGVGSIPTCRKNVGSWLFRNGVSPETAESEGGPCKIVALSDLPAPERLAYIERSIATLGLPLGAYDDAAHETFMQATAGMGGATLCSVAI